MSPTTMLLRVADIAEEAQNILSYVFVHPSHLELPGFTAGSHVDLHLSNGMVRSYSLSNHPGERHRYAIAVARDPKSRGGSIHVQDTLRPGEMVEIGLPRNHFQLAEGPHPSVLIAGGIGITPILSMARHLQSTGAPFTLHYAARGRNHAAFVAALAEFGDKVHLHFDEERGVVLDIATIVAAAAPEAHLYCCGPKPMLDAYRSASADREQERIHLEQFVSEVADGTGDNGFTVYLAQSNCSFQVPPGVSILDVLLQHGIDVPYSCMEGTCGECEMAVLDGVPDHRDVVLTKKKRAENKVMMICCSRAKSTTIVLDA